MLKLSLSPTTSKFRILWTRVIGIEQSEKLRWMPLLRVPTRSSLSNLWKSRKIRLLANPHWWWSLKSTWSIWPGPRSPLKLVPLVIDLKKVTLSTNPLVHSVMWLVCWLILRRERREQVLTSPIALLIWPECFNKLLVVTLPQSWFVRSVPATATTMKLWTR